MAAEERMYDAVGVAQRVEAPGDAVRHGVLPPQCHAAPVATKGDVDFAPPEARVGGHLAVVGRGGALQRGAGAGVETALQREHGHQPAAQLFAPAKAEPAAGEGAVLHRLQRTAVCAGVGGVAHRCVEEAIDGDVAGALRAGVARRQGGQGGQDRQGGDQCLLHGVFR